MRAATARAHSNIAFIKYWGNLDDGLRLPANPSLSMNLDGLYTETTVTWDGSLTADTLLLNGQAAADAARQRVAGHLDALRQRLGLTGYARVESANNFPMGAGIASSASAFAALTVAATAAAGLDLPEKELTVLARLGSGSASRSVPDGFVVWYTANTHEGGFAQSIAPADHWQLVDVIAIVSDEHKAVGSTQGHHSAATSDLQAARVEGAPARVVACQEAVINRDFAALAAVVEHDSNLMHAVMMTSRPPLFYWQPASLTVMASVRQWRAEGLRVCYTLDAGPNVHCICAAEDAPVIAERLVALAGVRQVFQAGPGAGARVVQRS